MFSSLLMRENDEMVMRMLEHVQFKYMFPLLLYIALPLLYGSLPYVESSTCEME